jgi:hypothetical protein
VREDGKILGRLTWTFEQKKDEAAKITFDRKEGKPSPEFEKAVKAFAKTHTRKKESDGQLYWWCPETGKPDPDDAKKKILGPTGKETDPFGKSPIPGEFKKAWVASLIKPVKFDGEYAFGGAGSYHTMDAAVVAASRTPAHAALKFTWTGNQLKSRVGVILSSRTDLEPADLAPHLTDETLFVNDVTIGLMLYEASADFMAAALGRLKPLSGERTSHGNVILTLIPDVGAETARSFTARIRIADVHPLVQGFAHHPDTSDELLIGLQYLALNFGQP